MQFSSIRLAIAAAAMLAGVVHAQSVTPPPLPPGSAMARPDPGMNEPERKRAERAHHHKMHYGKDMTRDDSVAVPLSAGAGAVRPVGTRAGATAGTGAGVGAAAGTGARGTAVQGGAGTGPAREKTDRGASSYFFNNKK